MAPAFGLARDPSLRLTSDTFLVMPTFIDESGDTGPGMTSARFFRLVAVCFEHTEAIPTFSENVILLRDRLQLPQTFEFHFSHINHRQRLAFLEMAAAHPFIFVASCFEKDSFPRDTLSKAVIRQTTIGGLVRHLGVCYRLAAEKLGAGRHLNERIVYDECHDPAYVADLKQSFSKTLAGTDEPERFARLVKSIKPGKSKSDPCLQLADMVCGSISSHLAGQHSYHEIIRKNQWEIEILDPPNATGR